MIVNQIKSILRNKANVIYIVIMVVLFVALNISINIQTIIDVFFDVQMNNYTEKMKVEQIKEVKIEQVTYISSSNFRLTEEKEREIKNIKHVEKIVNHNEICYIIVDDWKDIEYVQNVLDKKGIQISRVLVGIDMENLYKSYSQVCMMLRAVMYIIILATILMLYFCYKNILRNEQENIKLLTIIGYNKKTRKRILYLDLLALVLIALVFALLIEGIIYINIMININKQVSLSIIENIVSNLLIIGLPLIACIQKQLKNN